MKKNIYESSIYLLILMFITLLLTFILYYLNISITVFNFPLSILITSIIFILLKNKLNISNVKKSIILSLIIIILSTTISSLLFDRSSDGNTYHKDAIGNLKNGWNPVYVSTDKFVNKDYNNENGYDMSTYNIWKDHYAKANWILEANIYKLTNNIESAKAINLIFMFILFGIAYEFLYEKIGKYKALALSLIISINPITSAQLFTFYNDQLGTTILYTLIISLLETITNKNNKFNNFLIMSLTFMIAINIKFNIMGYAMIFTFIFMVKYLYDIFKNNKDNFKNIFKKLVLLFIPLFFIAFIVFGYSTYIKNYIDHKNPFFPVYGDNSEDIITQQEPVEFLKYNNFQKVFYATFSKVNNLMEDRQAHLKIPFTLDINEIKTTASVDTRISGNGVFYSGILILSLLIITLTFKKMSKKEKQSIILLICPIVLITFFISEGWWARYNPTMYIITIISLYLLLKYNKNKLITNSYILLVIVNTLLILILNTGYTTLESIKTQKILLSLRNKEIEYNLNYGEPIAVLNNLNDYHIKYKYNENLDNSNITYFKYINYKER